ncbi:hypothetical protein AVEN_52018-1 [Araneus ventricosus]|uniref:Uncharacterized protein n=1 Tax=Araneus ventricosus TaxID=182803 RepID=A0A4Y2CGA7_ARAVE|nr:hypothetical protein AVEN_52018-1 [Araneus ventricosus]
MALLYFSVSRRKRKIAKCENSPNFTSHSLGALSFGSAVTRCSSYSRCSKGEKRHRSSTPRRFTFQPFHLGRSPRQFQRKLQPILNGSIDPLPHQPLPPPSKREPLLLRFPERQRPRPPLPSIRRSHFSVDGRRQTGFQDCSNFRPPPHIFSSDFPVDLFWHEFGGSLHIQLTHSRRAFWRNVFLQSTRQNWSKNPTDLHL